MGHFNDFYINSKGVFKEKDDEYYATYTDGKNNRIFPPNTIGTGGIKVELDSKTTQSEIADETVFDRLKKLREAKPSKKKK